MKNNFNIFSLKIFNSGCSNFEINYFNDKPICLLQIFDNHNHPFFNAKTAKIGLINNHLNKYQYKLFKHK
jgi:hypothetical protein